MKKIIYAALLAIASVPAANSQSLPQYNMYTQNAMLINPAYTGIENFSEIKLGGRQQWLNINGAPMTGMFSFNTSIRPKGANPRPYSLQVSDTNIVSALFDAVKPGVHFGLGGYVIYDRIGAYDRIIGTLTYAVHFPIGKKVMLAIAPSLGINNTGFDPSKVNMLEPNDVLYQQYLGNGGRFTNLDFGMGTVVYGKNWSIGYSALQLLQNKVYFGTKPTDARLNIHHQIMGSYNFRLGTRWEMIQSFIVKIPYPNPVSFDVNLKFRYNQCFWFGASYRYNNSAAVMLGFTVAKLFSMGYSFDYPYNNMRTNNFGTHEVVLGFALNKRKHNFNYLW